MREFKLPELGEDIENAEVTRVLVSEGDEIEEEQNVLELETEKATIELPCPYRGRVEKIHVKEGDTISVGDTVLSLEGEEDDARKTESQQEESGAEESASDKSREDAEEEDAEEEDADKEDAEEEDADKEDADKEDAEEEDAEEEDADKEDADKEDADKEDADKEDADKEDADKEDADKEDADKEGKRKRKKRARKHVAEEGEADSGEEEHSKKESAVEKEERDTEADDSTEDRAEEPELEDEEETATEPPWVREERGPAGPGTRRLARELDVDLSDVSGTGSGGRITRGDVRAHARRAGQRDDAGLPDFEQWGLVDRRKLSRTMRAVAKNVATSWQLIPHVTHHELADITDLEELRGRYVEEHEPSSKITLTALTLKVAAIALEENRRFNSSFDARAQEIIVKDYIHLGVAVDTERGLVVPVIRDCDRKSIVQLAAEVSDLAERARSAKLGPDELEGGTFTITNLGGIGGVAFTPIIRYPEVAILGLSRAAWKSVEEDADTEQSDSARRRLLLPLSLSYDHRVINGADAARFAARIAELLAQPTRWLFEG